MALSSDESYLIAGARVDPDYYHNLAKISTSTGSVITSYNYDFHNIYYYITIKDS